MELSQDTINSFVIAAHHDLEKVQELLAEHPALLNENAEWVETPIQAAAHTGQRAIAEYLLDKGAPLDICTASMLGRIDDVRMMLADTPDAIHATGAHNIPVMYFAAIGGNVEIAKLLTDAGADINAGAGGNTALHGAAGFGQTEMVSWLLGKGADPGATDFEGRTPLELAEKMNRTESIALIRQMMNMYENIMDAEDAAEIAQAEEESRDDGGYL